MQKHLTYDELSAVLGIPKATLYSMVCRAEIPHVRLGRRQVRFPVAEIEAWLRDRFVRPGSGGAGSGSNAASSSRCRDA